MPLKSRYPSVVIWIGFFVKLRLVCLLRLAAELANLVEPEPQTEYRLAIDTEADLC